MSMTRRRALAVIGGTLAAGVAGAASADDTPAHRGWKPPKGPAPRFVTVQSLDAGKGELLVSEESLPHPAVESRVISAKEANRRDEPVTVGSTLKLKVLYYTTTHKLLLKQVTLYEAGGKKLPEVEQSRLKTGMMVLMSADGHPLEPEYTALVKPDVLVLVVDVLAIPSVYESLESTEGHTKVLRK
jgi:hypothetical protein